MEIIQKKSSLTANNMDSSLTSFLQHHPDGAYIKNLAGDIIFQNHNLPIFTDLAAQAESVEEKVRTADTAVANVEINAKKENGTTHTLSMTCTPWMQDNRISGTISQFRDITEERAKEIALAESTNLMQLVLEHLPVRVFWKNQDLVYMGMNTVFANDMGFERPDQLIGHDDYHTNMTHEEADICRADDFYVLESREGRYGAEEVIRSEEADDGISWIRVSKVPLHNAAGSMIGVSVSYTHLTLPTIA